MLISGAPGQWPSLLTECRLHAQVIRDKITNHSRGFAFVTFSHPAAASCAHAQLNGATMYGPFSGRALRLGPSNRTAAAAEE